MKFRGIDCGRDKSNANCILMWLQRDYGFAPNPFFRVCTLATCKPDDKKSMAKPGDLIVGTGSDSKKWRRGSHLVYIMRVAEALTFNQYWEDPRFVGKIPTLKGSSKQGYGDNIYFKDSSGKFHQENSHHSNKDGTPDQANICNDTQTDRVLIGCDYIYWGGDGPLVIRKFASYQKYGILPKRNYRSRFPPGLVEDFDKWFKSTKKRGYHGRPIDWPKI